MMRNSLSVTTLAQYIRLENCQRFLRFRIHPDEAHKLARRWRVTEQPLTPLLRESGAEFERAIATHLAERGEPVVDMDGKDVDATVEWFYQAEEPTILLQPVLEGEIGNYSISGRADIVRLHHDRRGRLYVHIADIKASRMERTEHRLQVATYAQLLRSLAEREGLQVAALTVAVLHIQKDGSLPELVPESSTFELDTYVQILHNLLAGPDNVVDIVATLPFDQVSYHLGYKCDGCLYNAVCMIDSTERLDLSLVPHLSAVEKRVLQNAGIADIEHLASLMQLPAQGSNERELAVTSGQESRVDRLRNEWPVGQNLPLLVQRAKAALHRQDAAVDRRSFLYGAGFGSLPSEQDHPDLVKVFFDAQRDYLADRVYLLAALVAGPRGERVVVRHSDAPPTADAERDLLIVWVRDVIAAARVVAEQPLAPVHLYCYNRYDQRVLLDALKRHLDEVAALPAFFDLMTQSPALSQPIISFLASELEERTNLGMVCSPLHDAARALGFDWRDDEREYFSLFRARLFDNRGTFVRQPDGALRRAGSDEPGRLIIEVSSRFNSQIPLEYAYAAWGRLPVDLENDRLLDPFRRVNWDDIRAFAAQRVRALAHIEGSFRFKARFLEKQPVQLPALGLADGGPTPLSQSLEEFLFMEHHATLQAKLFTYSLPIDRRVQTGTSLLLRFQYEDTQRGVHRFTIDFAALGLDPVLTMNAFKLKEGAWVVLNEADDSTLSANKIKNGRLATIVAVGSDWLELNLLGITFGGSTFRYYHKNTLRPQPGQRCMIDEMADDINADKVLEGLRNIDYNTLYRWLLQPPARRPVLDAVEEFHTRFADLIDVLEKPHKLTAAQRGVIAGQLDQPLFLVQGPPGTGKSYTLAWAILARMAAALSANRPIRVAVCCFTHNAINIVLEALAAKWTKLASIAMPATKALGAPQVYKVVNDASDETPKGVRPLVAYDQRQLLDPLLSRSPIIFGATAGGLYNVAKYRGAGGRNVEWSAQPFDLLVIDEASQMSLPQGVLAGAFLKPDGSIIVVGDHRQMPPIIAHNWQEEEKRTVAPARPYLSLFESLIERGFPRVSLDESFRLHKTMAKFLQDNIYVRDGIHFFSRRTALLDQPPSVDPFVDTVLDPAYPIIVVEHSEQRSQQYNETEIALIGPLIAACAQMRLDGSDGVGIVVPHRAQRALLKSCFPNLAVAESIDTVERFQGGERDVIMVSATASDPDYVLAEADFLLNLNRLNVAISRPRKKLVVIASRSVIDLLTSDLAIFENAVIWKRLYYHYADAVLWQGERHGAQVNVRGKAA